MGSTEGAAAAVLQPAPGRVGTVLRGGGWNLLGQGTPLVVGIVLTPYVVHGLGVDRYGLFAIATTVTTFASSFDGGLRASAQRYLSVYAGQRDDARTTRLVTTLSLLVTGLGALTSLVMYVASPALLAAFGAPPALLDEGTFLLRTLAVTASLGLLQGLFTALLNARHRYSVPNTTRAALYLGYAAGVVLSVSGGYGLRGIAVTLLAQATLSAAVLIPAASRYLLREHVGLVPRREFAGFVRYAARVQLTGLAGLVNLEADVLIVGAFSPLAAVGLYSVGATFAAQLRAVPTNALGPVQSMLGEAHGRDGDAGSRAAFERLQRLWVLGSTGWLAVGVGASYFGVRAWLGEGYGLAAVVAVVLLAGHLVNMWTGVLTLWLGVVGRPELEARYGVVGMVLNVVLTVALAIPFGVLGVVTATAVAQVLGSLYLRWTVRRAVPGEVRSFLRDVPVTATAAGLLATVGTELLVQPMCPDGALGLLVAGGCALPGLVVYVLGALGPRRAYGLVRRGVAGRRGPAAAHIGTGVDAPAGV